MAWDPGYSRAALLAEPFPKDWERMLVQNVAHFAVLNDEERSRLGAIVQVLVAEKNWEGCGGLAVTEEMKVTIAGQAGLLLLGIEHDYFPRVQSILVYPSVFIIPDGEWLDVIDPANAAAGQAVYRGPVILAWDEALEEGRDPLTGDNVVIHEFTHQLDFEDGLFNGTPVLPSATRSQRWATVMDTAFAKHHEKLERGRRTLLPAQAADSPGEFFASVTEKFFTRPDRLQQWYPEVFAELKAYFAVDPGRWLGDLVARLPSDDE